MGTAARAHLASSSSIVAEDAGPQLMGGPVAGAEDIENEDGDSHGSYRPESNFGTSDTVTVLDRLFRMKSLFLMRILFSDIR